LSEHSPSVIILAGPNGAGKSTAAPFLLQGTLGVTEFVDADVTLYAPLASTWRLYDGSRTEVQVVAQRLEDGVLEVYDEGIWTVVRKQGIDK
jgi:predicted ABC-type ATPase